MHQQIIQYITLLGIIMLVVMLSHKAKMACSIPLVITGIGLGFLPFFRGIMVNPDTILVLFLPPLTYRAAWYASTKDLLKWRWSISTFALLVVILTSGIIGILSYFMIPGFSLAEGFLLGGIISAPDSVSTETIMTNVKVPKRLLTIAAGESLFNDAPSLVIYKFSIAAIITGAFVLHIAVINFLVVMFMGAVCGLIIGIIFYAIHRLMPKTANTDIMLTFIAPYAMYIISDSLGFSGVLAVVVGGLFLSNRKHIFLLNRARVQGINTWETVTFTLNGFIFMLIGLQLPTIVKDVGSAALKTVIIYSVSITAALLMIRLAVTYSMFWAKILFNILTKRPKPKETWKSPLLFGWAAIRGVVSLAAALSIPLYIRHGVEFPNRNLILIITFLVILLSLIIQGLSLPLIIKWANLKETDFQSSFDEQKRKIRRELSSLIIDILENKYADPLKTNKILQGYRAEIKTNISLLKNINYQSDGHIKVNSESDQYQFILRDLFKEQRLLLIEMNKKENISEDIIREELELLDIEEERLARLYG